MERLKLKICFSHPNLRMFAKQIVIFFHSYIVFNSFYFSLPWNQQNILGWIVSVTLAILNSMVLYFLNGTFLSFFVSLCECHKAFQLVFENLTEILNENIEKNDCIAMKSALCELIRQNIIGKEWVQYCRKKFKNPNRNLIVYFQFFQLHFNRTQFSNSYSIDLWIVVLCIEHFSIGLGEFLIIKRKFQSVAIDAINY